MKRFLLLLAVLALAVTACAPAAAPTPAVTREVVVTRVEVAVEKPKTTVRLSGWAANPQETALLESLLYRCSLKNPDIVVKYEPITGDYWAKIKTLVASKEEPDIYYMDIFQFPFFATKGVLVPLDDYMAKSGVKKDDFIKTLIGAFTGPDGKVYGIPKDFNTLALFYNKELFAKAGIPEPNENWTWDDLKNAARRLSDPAKGIYGLGVPADAGRFPIFVFQNGGRIMKEDFSDTLLDGPEAAEAARFYTSFRAERIGSIPADVGVDWQGTAFGQGKLAMVFEGGWLIPYLREQFPNLQWGATFPPAGPKGRGNLIFTVAYVISSNSKNPEAAWKTVECLTSEESQKVVLSSGFALPSLAKLSEDEYFKTRPESLVIFKGAEFGTPFVWGLRGDVVNEQMSKALERIYLEGQDVSASLKQAAEEIRKALKEQQ